MNFAPMLVYIAVACFTPGPNNLMTMYLCARHGFRGTRKFITASSICFFIKLLLCGALNVALATAIPAVTPYLKWVGAAYMLYLAVHIFLGAFKKKEEQADAPADGESTYKSGVLLQVLNIKSWIFALSVFSIYVVPYTTAMSDILLCTVISTANMFAATLLWALCGAAISKLYNKHILICSAVMALSLVWCAVTAVL